MFLVTDTLKTIFRIIGCSADKVRGNVHSHRLPQGRRQGSLL